MKAFGGGGTTGADEVGEVSGGAARPPAFLFGASLIAWNFESTEDAIGACVCFVAARQLPQ